MDKDNLRQGREGRLFIGRIRADKVEDEMPILPSKSWCIKLYHPDMCVYPLLQEASTLRLFSSNMDEIDRLIISPVDRKFSFHDLSPGHQGRGRTAYVIIAHVSCPAAATGEVNHIITYPLRLLSEQERMAPCPDLRQQVIHIYKGELHLSPLPKSTGHWR